MIHPKATGTIHMLMYVNTSTILDRFRWGIQGGAEVILIQKTRVAYVLGESMAWVVCLAYCEYVVKGYLSIEGLIAFELLSLDVEEEGHNDGQKRRSLSHEYHKYSNFDR